MFTHEMIASFNELETSLYNYISQNSEKVVYMRIRELANETHVSTASILRFCKKINCEGFSEFKVKLKMYTEANKKTILKSPHHSVAEFFERTVSGGMEEKLKEAATLAFAKMSDVNISYYVTEEWVENANITTQIPAMYILESMAREIYKLRE